jgi:LysR family transcriptional regulator, glycine cleavage system transcriptional activator
MQIRNARPLPAAARAQVPRSRRLRLDLLNTFEAAARLLSFTEAGKELFLSQSAVSRQIQQLESSLGVALYERGHRALALTEAGRIMQRAVNDALERLRDAAARIQPAAAMRQVAITCTPGFASFWLIPRLAHFTATHPQVDVRISATLEVVDLERSQIDLAVRFAPSSMAKGPLLFEEEVQPMCSPALLRDARRPLETPADLEHHTLLTLDMPQGEAPTVDWEPWLQVIGLAAVRSANTVRFTHYAEAVAAACAGQGVVIGRLPLLLELVREGKLVAPFRGRATSRRGYFVTMASHAAGNVDAQDFAQWLIAEAEQAQRTAVEPAPRPRARKKRT